MAVARALALPGGAEDWARLGFAPGEPVGDVAVAFGGPRFELAVEGLAAERPAGLPIVSTTAGPAGSGRHPNGALAIDHVVAVGELPRLLPALAEAGLELRRERKGRTRRQAFYNLRTLVLEVVDMDLDEPALWGAVFVTEDIESLGPLYRPPHDAVQSGRRIAVANDGPHLPVQIAFMTPRPKRSRPS
jgi:hypothetical protein